MLNLVKRWLSWLARRKFERGFLYVDLKNTNFPTNEGDPL